MAAPAHAISRAAELLGEDEELLWDMATDMEPEDGCLWIHGTDDQQTVAFNDGMEYLREMLPEYKRNRSALLISAKRGGSTVACVQGRRMQNQRFPIH
jgi:hypothetical protein